MGCRRREGFGLNDLVTETFQHPQATHAVELATCRVAYLLVRSARRSVGLEVGDEGLVIRAPMRLSLARIESVLHEKARWIVSKLQARQVRLVLQPRMEWMHGAWIPYLGGQLQLQLNTAAPRSGELLAIGEGRWALHLPLPRDTGSDRVRASLQAWWLRHVRELFTQRLNHYAPMLGVRWMRLRLSNAQTRWGSAKTDGSIMLNWRLLHFRLPVLDYVVIHELAHLRVMDHSPRFWSVVASICPDYLPLRQELRHNPTPDWSLPVLPAT